MEIHERLRQARIARGYRQNEFGELLGFKQSTYSSYENGARPISQSLAYMICDILSINLDWLLTGDGDMEIKRTEDEEIAYFLGKVMSSDDSDVRKRIISALARTSPEDWEVFARFLERLTETK